MAQTPEKSPRLNTQMEDALKANGITPKPETESATPQTSPEVSRLEAEEQQAIDKRIAQAHSADEETKRERDRATISMKAEGIDLDVGMPSEPLRSEAILERIAADEKAKTKERKSAQDRTQEERSAPPAELVAMFGNTVPKKVIEMFEKLKSPKKREEYVAHVRKEIEEKKKAEDRKAPGQKRGTRQTGRKARQEKRQRKNAATKPLPLDAREPLITPLEEPQTVDAVLGKHRTIGPGKPEARKEASPEITRSDYLRTYSELLKFLKSKYGKDVPSELAEQVGFVNKGYIEEQRKEKTQKSSAELAARIATLGSILAEERRAPMRPNLKEPVATPEAMPLPGADEAILYEDATPTEAKKSFKNFITGAASHLMPGTTKKKPETPLSEKDRRWKEQVEKLERRSKELNTEADTLGRFGKSVRTVGEWYNKRDWKTKLAVGGALGIGAVAFGASSLPIAFGCMAGIGVQRVLGFSSMYQKYEKAFEGKEWKEKNKQWAALGIASAYTFLMGAAIKEGVEWASDTEFGHWVQRHVENFLSEKPSPMPAEPTHPTEAPPFVSAPPATAPAAEVPVVTAGQGHGYEWMAKRLWEQLHDPAQAINLPKISAGSDLEQLINADEKSIDSVVHRLALAHDAVRDGASALISENARMTIGTDGQLTVEGMRMSSIAPETVAIPEQLPPIEEPQLAPMEEMPHVLQGSAAVSEAQVESPAPSAEAAASPQPEVIYTATDRVPIDAAKPAIYEAHAIDGTSYLAAYGGSDEERFSLVQNYLAEPEHKGQTVRFAHEVTNLTGKEMHVEDIGAGAQGNSSSWLLRFFEKPPAPPSPDTFLRKLTP